MIKGKCYALKKRLTTGLGGRCLGAGRCPVASPTSAGHGGPIWETASIVLMYICILLKIHGDYQQDAGTAKGVTRLERGGGLGLHML